MLASCGVGRSRGVGGGGLLTRFGEVQRVGSMLEAPVPCSDALVSKP